MIQSVIVMMAVVIMMMKMMMMMTMMEMMTEVLKYDACSKNVLSVKDNRYIFHAYFIFNFWAHILYT